MISDTFAQQINDRIEYYTKKFSELSPEEKPEIRLVLFALMVMEMNADMKVFGAQLKNIPIPSEN